MQKQILPVVPRGSRADIIQATFKASYLWEHVSLFHLTENMRVRNGKSNDIEYAQYLLDVGNGKIPTNPKMYDMIKIPIDMESEQGCLEGFCMEIFPKLNNRIKDGMKLMDVDDNWNKFVHERAIICPRNVDVADVNTICMGLMEREATTFLSADSCIQQKDAIRYPVEYLNQLITQGTPDHTLVLKIGVPIILLRNFDPVNGHVNGAQ